MVFTGYLPLGFHERPSQSPLKPLTEFPETPEQGNVQKFLAQGLHKVHCLGFHKASKEGTYLRPVKQPKPTSLVGLEIGLYLLTKFLC